MAFAIMSFVLAGALSLFIYCIFLNEANRNLSIATGHGQFVLEDIKNTNFNSLKTGAIDVNTTWDWNTAASFTGRGLSILGNESINTTGVWTGTERVNITVAVSWKDRGTRDRSLSLTTLITEP